MPVTDVIEEQIEKYGIDGKYYIGYKPHVVDGEMWYVFAGGQFPYHLMYRQDILEEKDIRIPTNPVNDTWTMDESSSVLVT